LAGAPVAAAAILVTALLVAVAGRYGPHRDELYFVAAGHHPAWGYPDQPSLTPLVAAALDDLAPGNVTVLHLFSAVVAGIMVVVSALTARELGGGRAAQILMAVVTGTGVVTLVIGHILSTTTLDMLFWMLIIWLALCALGRDNPRYWLTAGLVAGVGLENKQLVGFLLAALGVGLLTSEQGRRQLRSGWLWAGVVAAVALAVPDLIWQAANGWPELTVSADINDEYRVPSERVFYVVQQLVLFSPLAGLLWLFGLVQLLRRRGLAWARPFGVAYLVLFVIFAVSGGKGYYMAGIIPVLAAAGCVVLAEHWTTRGLAVGGVCLGLAAAFAWPAALPLLSATTLSQSFYSGLAEDQLETVGWPAFVATVSSVLDSLPPTERSTAVVYTGNYGEAGAVAYYDRGAPVYSGHNGWGWWGPPPQGASPVVVVGLDDPSSAFSGCQRAARIDNGLDVDNEEQGKAVWLCTAPRGGWTAAWPQLEHLDG
jgi:hypothetical protein